MLMAITAQPTIAPPSAMVFVRDRAQGEDSVVVAPERLIIRNGSMTLVVDDTRAAQGEVERLVNEMAGEGAFIVSSNERSAGSDRPPQISMSIRVPATRFTETMDKLAALAVEVRGRNETAQDVTEEYVDLKARLESLAAARDRLRGIMEEAQTTEDLLRAEQQLTQRETEIEAFQGRAQYLEQAARLSSITIELQPSVLSQPVAVGWRPAETTRQALERLVERGQDFVDFLISFVIADLPWLLFFGVIIFIGVRAGLRWRARRAKQSLVTASSEKESKAS